MNRSHAFEYGPLDGPPWPSIGSVSVSIKHLYIV